MKRYIYIDNHEVPLIIDTDMYVYVMGFEPFRPIRIRARDTKDSWLLFISSEDCTAYYSTTTTQG